MMKKLLVMSVMTVLLAACTRQQPAESSATAQPAPQQAIQIFGAGGTFPYPLYSKMFDAYAKQNNIQTDYQAIGSGGGIRQVLAQTIDFGASDGPMSDADMAKAKGPILHIPTCLGADVISYNLPGNPKLKLTPDVIADIFLGTITSWKDPRIVSLNPGVPLPEGKMLVAHRTDGSGTTFIFSDYLTKVSPAWARKVGRGTSVNWPVGIGGKGNQGVAGIIKQTPGSIGYTELIYALSNNMPVADVKNKSGNFITPSIDSVSLAANTALPPDTRVSLTDTDAAQGYPISSFTWLLLYKDSGILNRSKEKAQAVVNLFWWMIHDGQQFAKPLEYAPLPDAAVKAAETLLRTASWNGQKLLNQ